MQKERIKGLVPIVLVGLVVVVLAGGFWQYDDKVYLPVPYIRPLNPRATIQWEPEAFNRPAPVYEGKDHPGLALAQVQCVRCHSLPRPQQLPRDTWPFVLTWMANYLGYTNTYMPFGNNVEASLMPAQPLVSEAELQAIASYYLLHSPTAQELSSRDGRSQPAGDRFNARKPDLGIPPNEVVTLVDFDETQRRFLIGRAGAKTFQVFDAAGTLLHNVGLTSEPIGVHAIATGLRLTVMGDFMEDKRRGQVLEIPMNSAAPSETTIVVDGYHRLTESHSDDLDGDGEEDLLLIGFGAGVTGRVSIRWRERGVLALAETVLIDYSGALNAVVHDFNLDGEKDVMILTAQSKQELLVFLNLGNRQFERHLIRQDEIGFGANHLVLGDLNQDGRADVVLINGNNMEIKNAPLKPYHGVRILENQGGLRFREVFFYPMYGALKALVNDFDRDGDLDIAVIAFYPNWNIADPETFVWLENRGGNKFQAWGLPAKDAGRWIALADGDVNGDGWPDLILGGGYVQHGVDTRYRERYASWSRGKPSVVVLENSGRQRTKGIVMSR